MELTNYTPFPALAWESSDSVNKCYVTTLCRAKFKLVLQNSDSNQLRLSLDPKQGDLFGSDVYIDEDDARTLRYPSDYVPFKPNGDLIVNGQTYSPEGIPRGEWNCAVKVFDPEEKLLLEKRLHVCGKRFWRKTFLGWKLDKPEVCSRIPIHYSYAFGGKAVLGNKEEIVDDYNLSGCGIVHKKQIDKVIQAPQIESHDNPIDPDKPYEVYLPQGFGAIDRTSYYRLQHAGTYDKKWLEEHHPDLPSDFKEAYHQSAHPDLIMKGYFLPCSSIRLIHLSKEMSEVSFVLPSYTFASLHTTNTAQLEQAMNIDTVIIDMDDEDQSNWSVYVSWRSRHLIDETIQKVEIVLHEK